MRVQASGLRKKYGDRIVVDGLNLEIKPGQILGLLGPNGAGKSTTIKMLSGQIKPDHGEILINGNRYNSVPRSLRGNIGVMPQEVIIWDNLNVKENLYFTGRMQNMSDSKLSERVEYLIRALNLQKEISTLGKNLSGGFKRRLNLAISIIHEPSLIFLDEPTPGIDPQNRRFLWDFLGELRGSERYSVVLTDHYLDEAEKLSDYVVIMDDGREIAKGTVKDLKSQYTNGNIIKVDFTERMGEEDITFFNNKFANIKFFEDKMTLVTKKVNSDLKELMNAIEEKKLNTEDISIKEPTLEDVFLILTGKEIRE